MAYLILAILLVFILCSPSNSKRALAQSNRSFYEYIGGGSSIQLPNEEYLIIDDGSFTMSFGQAVFGGDERKQVIDTTIAPFSGIGQVGQRCTGTAIGPRHVLTAAHCIYDRDSKTYKADNEFIPGRNGQDLPFGAYDWEYVFIPDSYKSQNSNLADRSDYALIILKEELDPSIQILPFGNACLSKDIVFALNVVGYPSDLIMGQMYTTACVGIRFNCDWKLFEHFCDTREGMSGSGMISAFNRTDNELGFSVKAIHTAVDTVDKANIGIIITEELERQLWQWIKQYE
eukprot:TRINITY_DN5471_c1_g1_i1.p1 TRINITY_DN5471_c1_g1~~TRINITY_DN5471_c1_g1_i1.p1  ORF type:complete len:288 (-),score=11.31 TRINITY_DN5471_c1_g1_i1:371-1234(-)